MDIAFFFLITKIIHAKFLVSRKNTKKEAKNHYYITITPLPRDRLLLSQ